MAFSRILSLAQAALDITGVAPKQAAEIPPQESPAPAIQTPRDKAAASVEVALDAAASFEFIVDPADVEAIDSTELLDSAEVVGATLDEQLRTLEYEFAERAVVARIEHLIFTVNEFLDQKDESGNPRYDKHGYSTKGTFRTSLLGDLRMALNSSAFTRQRLPSSTLAIVRQRLTDEQAGSVLHFTPAGRGSMKMKLDSLTSFAPHFPTLKANQIFALFEMCDISPELRGAFEQTFQSINFFRASGRMSSEDESFMTGHPQYQQLVALRSAVS